CDTGPVSDFITAFRSLRKSPGFTLVAVLTIAVGIGANTALFSVFDRLVLNPVTLPQPQSLVAIWANNPKTALNAPVVSWPRYEAIRDHATSFSSLANAAFDSFTLTGNGEPEQLNSLRVTATFLPTLGILPARGRNFTADEDVPNGPAVCILSDELWQTRFGSRETIVGETIRLNGQPWEVVGVMPPRLSPPFNQAQLLTPRVFEVAALTARQVQNGSGYSQPLARLKPGVTLQQAASELSSISASYGAQFGSRLDATTNSEPKPFVQSLVGSLEPTFYTLLGAVSFVLLIACANVASLFLGRLVARRKEIAVRQSLGATRVQVVRQFLVESLMFSLVAGVLGTLLALWTLASIRSLLTSQLPPNAVLTLNGRALLFTVAVTFVSALLVGLFPALQASRAGLVEVLKDGARGSSGGGRRFRGAMMIVEIALSVVLLVGSSLLLMSFLELQRAAPGFEARGAATAFVGVPIARYQTPVQQAEFFNQVIEKLKADPRVTDAAAGLGLPLSGFNPRGPYSVGGRPILPLPERPIAGFAVVSDDYFKVLRITLAEGRAFTPADRDGAPGVCVVNESFARHVFPGESAIGKVLMRGPNAEFVAQIVGVIRDVRTTGLTVPVTDEIYFAMRQLGRPGMSVLARTTGDPAALQAVIRSAVLAVDPDQPISFFATLETNLALSLGAQRIVASLTTVFAGLALVLSAVGLYSVLAYAVSQRAPEIGIRMALGAQRGQVVRLIMRSGLDLVAIGLVLGLVSAAGAARVIQSLLYGVEPMDLRVYATVALMFIVVAVAACLVPSLRASRIDPLLALRTD
ncbi:MAG: ABC transporter permease, partial [Vicinamibacterales bacterium]